MEIQFPFPLIQYFFLFFFLTFLLVKECRKSRTGQKLPPGPWRLPVIGNLHQIIGSLPHHAFRNLAKKHGPLMYIKLGELPTIVVSSPKMAKEIMKTNDVAFADRMELVTAEIALYNCADISTAPYGEQWRQMRKLCIVEFLSQNKVRLLHSLMEDEVLRLVHSVRFSQGQPINLTREIVSLQYKIISRATVGRVCKDIQESLIMMIKEVVSIALVFNFEDIFPSMKFLHPLSALSSRRLHKMHKKIDYILEDIIRQHEEKRFVSGNGRNASGDSMEREDILDILLRLSESKDLQVPITRDNIKANIFLMFMGSVESLSSVIEWSMSEMMKNPRVLRKAQAEVRESLHGKERFPESDLQKLKYLKMVIKETLRLHSPGPLLFPKRCREQCKIDGYDIPVNTIVMINAWAIGRDPEYWQNPEEFEPERFEDNAIDFKGNHFEFIPFGAGRRICAGMAFGLASVELALAHLLYHFDWKIPGGIGPEEFDMAERNHGTSAGRKNNLCLIAKYYDQLDGTKATSDSLISQKIY